MLHLVIDIAMHVIIEMPKGDTRRRHLKYDKSGIIDLGLIRDSIPVNDGVMPVAYGYIPDTVDVGEGDDVDVLVFSGRAFAVGEAVDVRVIGLLRRADGDHKVVAVERTSSAVSAYEDVSAAERTLIEEFFGYHHKIVAVEDADDARQFVDACRMRDNGAVA